MSHNSVVVITINKTFLCYLRGLGSIEKYTQQPHVLCISYLGWSERMFGNSPGSIQHIWMNNVMCVLHILHICLVKMLT